MHRTSRILALTTLLFAAGAALFFTKAAALPYKVAYPVLLLAVAVFCLRRKTLLPVGTALLLSALGDAAGAKGLFIPQMLFSRWPTVPISAISSAPGDFLPVLPHGCFPRRCSRCSSPGSCPGSWIRPNGSASPFTVRSSPGCFTACSGIAGRMPHGSASRPCCSFFRRRDSLEPFHRGRSRAHLRRDGSLLPGAVPVLLLCRKIASRPPV